MQKQFYLIRHGETEWNLDSKMQGWVDISLNSTGRQQAYQAIERLKMYQIERIVSSTLSRARETAEIMNAQLRVPFIQREGLREYNVGCCDGTNYQFVRMKYAHLFEQMQDKQNPDRDNICYPGGGECWNDVWVRLLPVFKEMSEKYPEHHILFVMHGIVLTELYAHLTGEFKPFSNCHGFMTLFNSDTEQFSNCQPI